MATKSLRPMGHADAGLAALEIKVAGRYRRAFRE